MASANLVVLVGNLTRNPELRHTPVGQAVTTLNVAVNRRYKDRDTGEWVEKVDFIPVSVWGAQAENCDKYLSKGRPVYIEGRLSQRNWESPSGEQRSKLEVIARKVQFLAAASRPSGQEESFREEEEVEETEQSPGNAEKEESADNEEVPF